MKINKILFAICLIQLLSGCTPNPNQNRNSQPTETTTDSKSTQENAVPTLYHSSAIKVISSDLQLNGPAAIREYNDQHAPEIRTKESLFSIAAHKERGIEYELIRFTTPESKSYTQLVIWELEKEEKRRVFEFEEYTPTPLPEVDLKEIANRRATWIALCNQHNAAELVNQLYSPNTIYFNHKPLLIGRTAVIADYAYMNNENYQLVLEPLTLEIVNSTTVFEIGQCKGSYNGKYILIWKKESDGVWRIFIDSNV